MARINKSKPSSSTKGSDCHRCASVRHKRIDPSISQTKAWQPDKDRTTTPPTGKHDEDKK